MESLSTYSTVTCSPSFLSSSTSLSSLILFCGGLRRVSSVAEKFALCLSSFNDCTIDPPIVGSLIYWSIPLFTIASFKLCWFRSALSLSTLLLLVASFFCSSTASSLSSLFSLSKPVYFILQKMIKSHADESTINQLLQRWQASTFLLLPFSLSSFSLRVNLV